MTDSPTPGRPLKRSSASVVHRVAHVVHGWPPHNHGGTELYARELALVQARSRDVAVYARVGDPTRLLGDVGEEKDRGVVVRLIVNNFHQRSPFSRNALRSPTLERDFGAFLDRTRPDLVHIHHLSGHCLGLVREAVRRRLRLVYQIQDWWALCARASLFDPRFVSDPQYLCPGPKPSRCSRCLPQTALPGARLWNPLLYGYRQRLARQALAAADAYILGSLAIENDYRRAGLLRPSDRVYRLPYGVSLPQCPVERREAPSLPVRFGIVGSIQPAKGHHIAAEAFRGLTTDQARLDLWGNPGADSVYIDRLQQCEVLRLRGRFDEAEKDRVYAEMDVLLMPSLGLESFGLVAREAMARGVPVIASRRGALAELFPEEGAGGTWIEPGDSDGLRRIVDRLLDDTSTIGQWRRRAPQVTSIEEHATLVDSVYENVLGEAQ